MYPHTPTHAYTGSEKEREKARRRRKVTKRKWKRGVWEGGGVCERCLCMDGVSVFSKVKHFN